VRRMEVARGLRHPSDTTRPRRCANCGANLGLDNDWRWLCVRCRASGSNAIRPPPPTRVFYAAEAAALEREEAAA